MSKVLSSLCRMVAVTFLLPVLTANAFSSEKIPVQLSNLCNFTYRDFKTIKPQYEALFPLGMEEGDAKARLKGLNTKLQHEYRLKEHRWLVIIWKLDFWKVLTGFGNPSELYTGEKLVTGLAECHPGEGLTTKWYMNLIISPTGRVTERELEVYLDDYDFAARGIALKPELFMHGGSFSQAIRSLKKTRLGSWDLLKQHLIENGFVMENGSPPEPGTQKPTPGEFGVYSVHVIMPVKKKHMFYRVVDQAILDAMMMDQRQIRVRIDYFPETRRVIAVN